MTARVRPPRSPFKNDLERDWSVVLEAMKRKGDLQRWDYEPEKLRIGNGAYFTPDFRLIWHDGEVSFDECKGFFREAALVRIKVAASLHPYHFRVVRKGGKGEPTWMIEEVKA